MRAKPSRHRQSSRTGLRSAVTSAAALTCITCYDPAPTLAPVVSAFQQVGSTSTSTTRAAHPIQSSFSRSRSSSTSTATHPSTTRSSSTSTSLYGWLDNFLPTPYDAEAEADAEAERRRQYPEQYPATYELLPPSSHLPQDARDDDPTASATVRAVRPLLKRTQLERRPLRVAYDANLHGWDGPSFHARVDGCGAAVVLATTTTTTTATTASSSSDGRQRIMVGGYNPKGWAGLGGTRPSVAAFLFYQKRSRSSNTMDADDNGEYGWQKLKKVGGGGLACANDDPTGGIYFGPDGLVMPLRSGDGDASRARVAQSKLGPYFERGPEDLASVFPGGAAVLEDLKVVVGVYADGEDIPYSGGVMDMTSG